MLSDARAVADDDNDSDDDNDDDNEVGCVGGTLVLMHSAGDDDAHTLCRYCRSMTLLLLLLLLLSVGGVGDHK